MASGGGGQGFCDTVIKNATMVREMSKNAQNSVTSLRTNLILIVGFEWFVVKFLIIIESFAFKMEFAIHEVWVREKQPTASNAWEHGRPQTFFQGGKNLLFALKNNLKDTIFPKKV
jgi:hypothetical protein